jgi:hypothetical protein
MHSHAERGNRHSVQAVKHQGAKIPSAARRVKVVSIDSRGAIPSCHSSGTARMNRVPRSSGVNKNARARRARSFVEARTPPSVSSLRYQFRLTPTASAISSWVTGRPRRVGSLLIGPSVSEPAGIRCRSMRKKGPRVGRGSTLGMTTKSVLEPSAAEPIVLSRDTRQLAL